MELTVHYLLSFSNLCYAKCMKDNSGFTLIELSIVLVIIGLIIGGILVGQDLIKSAEIRATITQLEKYNTAANTFRVKYGYLPGDIPAPYATQFGFGGRGSGAGQGDGNGVITSGTSCCNAGFGEEVMFWVDLNNAGMTEGSYILTSGYYTSPADVTGAAIASYLPTAKIGNGNYVYVWAGGTSSIFNGINYYGISAVNTILGTTGYGQLTASKALSPVQTYNIDQKMDDGLPESGRVLSIYINNGLAYWSDGTNSSAQTTPQTPDNTTINPGPTTCYDNAQGKRIKIISRYYKVKYGRLLWSMDANRDFSIN
jgi:prepilin-type N-terminal cleavage/methylation domain-containing protein